MVKNSKPDTLLAPIGVVGQYLGVGDVVITSSGRKTTPFPKVDISTNRRANKTIKEAALWLWDNAILEAEARGDTWNLRRFKHDAPQKAIEGLFPQASKDSFESYLFT